MKPRRQLIARRHEPAGSFRAGLHRVLKLARTIADLNDSEQIGTNTPGQKPAIPSRGMDEFG